MAPTSYTVLICTQCKREEREDSAINWIRTERVGIDAQLISDAPIDGLFCKARCLVAYLSPELAEVLLSSATPIAATELKR